MIASYPRLILRRLGRQKVNTTLHIVGLTLGMSVCLLIGLFLRYELTFDDYHDKAGRTYRINSVWTHAGKKSYRYSTPMPLAEALRSGVTGLESVTLAHPQQRSLYYGIDTWLQNFAFRIDIGWHVFVIVGAVSLVVALLTVSFQALKAAWANPVESLRTE